MSLPAAIMNRNENKSPMTEVVSKSIKSVGKLTRLCQKAVAQTAMFDPGYALDPYLLL